MTETNNYLIYGAGGQARVLKDLINVIGLDAEILAFFNDSDEPKEVDGIPVYLYDPTVYPDSPVVLGIGSAKVRKILSQKVEHHFSSLIHPAAIVAEDVKIEEGTVVLAGAVIQTGAKIGKHVIINANVTIDHDAIIGDYVTTYPGVYVGAEAIVMEGTTINPNAVIMRFVVTESFSEIGPGEVINK